jgi:hypothetical protein
MYVLRFSLPCQVVHRTERSSVCKCVADGYHHFVFVLVLGIGPTRVHCVHACTRVFVPAPIHVCIRVIYTNALIYTFMCTDVSISVCTVCTCVEL